MNHIASIVDDCSGAKRVRRDMDVVREILLHVEAREDLRAREIVIEGRDPLVVGRHIEMLHQEGLLDGTPIRSSSQPDYARVLVRDLTWEGHDLLAAMKNDTVWGQIKSTFSPSDLASMPLKVIKDVGVEALKQWALGQISGS